MKLNLIVEIGAKKIRAIASKVKSNGQKICVGAYSVLRNQHEKFENYATLSEDIKEAVLNVTNQARNFFEERNIPFPGYSFTKVAISSKYITILEKEWSCDLDKTDPVDAQDELYLLKYNSTKMVEKEQISKKILHCIPAEYFIDKKNHNAGEGLYKIVGYKTNYAKANYHYVLADKAFLQEIEKIFETQFGLKIDEFSWSSLASSALCISDSDQNNLKLVVNFGFKNTDIMVFRGANLVLVHSEKDLGTEKLLEYLQNHNTFERKELQAFFSLKRLKNKECWTLKTCKINDNVVITTKDISEMNEAGFVENFGQIIPKITEISHYFSNQIDKSLVLGKVYNFPIRGFDNQVEKVVDLDAYIEGLTGIETKIPSLNIQELGIQVADKLRKEILTDFNDYSACISLLGGVLDIYQPVNISEESLNYQNFINKIHQDKEEEQSFKEEQQKNEKTKGKKDKEMRKSLFDSVVSTLKLCSKSTQNFIDGFKIPEPADS